MKVIVSLVFALFAFSAQAHEYWIEPLGLPLIPTGELVEADFKVGQDFKGTRNAYIPQNIRRVLVASPDGTQAPLEGELGQRPAVKFQPQQVGCYVVGLVTSDAKLTWREQGKFLSFLDYEGFPHLAQTHEQRGLPADGFQESYARSVKALFQVGELGLRDQKLGLPLELVILEQISDSRLRVQLLRDGVPVADTQVRRFRRLAETADAVDVQTVRTDAQGQAEIDLSGGGMFMLNAVVLEPRQAGPDYDLDQPVWHSWWASVTFSL